MGSRFDDDHVADENWERELRLEKSEEQEPREPRRHPARVVVTLDRADAELVGATLMALARSNPSPDPEVAAQLTRVGDALRRAAGR